jgi:hypothetical protein
VHSKNKKCLKSFVGKVRIKILKRPGRRLEGFIKFDFKKKVCEDVHWI